MHPRARARGQEPPLLLTGGGFLALLVLAYLGFNGASLVQAKQKRDEVADRVTAELERALPAAADRQQDVVAAATREPDEAEVTLVDAATAEGEPWCTRTHSAPGTTRSLVGGPGTGLVTRGSRTA